MKSNKKDTIILNRVFAGKYQEKQLGHEIICFFEADNNEQYIYVNHSGRINKEAVRKTEGVMLVKWVEAGRLQILGYAYDLECLVDKNQKEYIKNKEIKYGGIPLDELFAGQDNYLFVTFKANKFKIPKEKLYLVSDEKSKGPQKHYICFKAKSSLKEYLKDGKYKISKDNMNEFFNFIDNKNLWIEKEIKK